MTKDLARFLQFVEMTRECWLWVGCSRGNRRADHGSFKVRLRNGARRTEYSHRWIFTKFFGRIPAGMQVNHHCDNMRCVNPAHLYLGTQKENVADMVARGRIGRKQ